MALAYTKSPQASLYYARKRRKARARLTSGTHGGIQILGPSGLGLKVVVVLKVG